MHTAGNMGEVSEMILYSNADTRCTNISSLSVLLCWCARTIRPLPDNDKALTVASSEKRFIIVEAYTEHWAGVPLQLVDAWLLLALNIQKIYARVLTSCNWKEREGTFSPFFS
jgi:hypothetical protein